MKLYALMLPLLLTTRPVVSQSNPIDGSLLSLQPSRASSKIVRFPFAYISVLDGRLDTSNAVGAYETKKHADVTFTIPLRIDGSLSFAVQNYLDNNYAAEGSTGYLCIYLRKYCLFEGKVALSADVYVEKDDGYHIWFTWDKVYKHHWRRYISGGALDELMGSVAAQWAQEHSPLGPPLKAEELDLRKTGINWNQLPINKEDTGKDGVFLSIQDFMQNRLSPAAASVDTIANEQYRQKGRFLERYQVHIQNEDTLYAIRFSSAPRWLRRWQRQPYGIVRIGNIYYFRFKRDTYLKLSNIQGTFSAVVSPDLIYAYIIAQLPYGVPGGGSVTADNSIGQGLLSVGIDAVRQAGYENRQKHDNVLSMLSQSRAWGGWHYVLDMDLQTFIIY